jgi:hypothetical protein
LQSDQHIVRLDKETGAESGEIGGENIGTRLEDSHAFFHRDDRGAGTGRENECQSADGEQCARKWHRQLSYREQHSACEVPPICARVYQTFVAGVNKKTQERKQGEVVTS